MCPVHLIRHWFGCAYLNTTLSGSRVVLTRPSCSLLLRGNQVLFTVAMVTLRVAET